MWETVYSVGSTTASIINILYIKAKGKNKGFDEELTISHHQNHHHYDHHHHLAGRDFEEVWPGVRLLLGSTPSARPKCSTLSSPPSLQLYHYLYRYSDQNITNIRTGQGSHSYTTSFSESHHPISFFQDMKTRKRVKPNRSSLLKAVKYHWILFLLKMLFLELPYNYR